MKNDYLIVALCLLVAWALFGGSFGDVFSVVSPTASELDIYKSEFVVASVYNQGVAGVNPESRYAYYRLPFGRGSADDVFAIDASSGVIWAVVDDSKLTVVRKDTESVFDDGYYTASGGVIKPNFDFDVEIVYQGYFFERLENLVMVRVLNNWKDDLVGNLYVYLSYVSPATGKVMFLPVDVLEGVGYSEGVWEEFVVRLPSTLATTSYKLIAVPTVRGVFGERSVRFVSDCPESGKSASYLCGGLTGCSESVCFGIAGADGQKTAVNLNLEAGRIERVLVINDNPVFISDFRCDSDSACLGYGDYVCTDTNYCLRRDVSDNGVPCMQIGCPVGLSCLSTGVCGQSIQTFADCKSDDDCAGVGGSCDVGSGLCILTEIKEEILQCSVASDCPVPCSSVTVICDGSNTCKYDGSCVVQEFRDCVSDGCTGGAVCNVGTGVCEKNVKEVVEVEKFVSGGGGKSGLGGWFWVAVIGTLIMLSVVLYRRK